MHEMHQANYKYPSLFSPAQFCLCKHWKQSQEGFGTRYFQPLVCPRNLQAGKTEIQEQKRPLAPAKLSGWWEIAQNFNKTETIIAVWSYALQYYPFRFLYNLLRNPPEGVKRNETLNWRGQETILWTEKKPVQQTEWPLRAWIHRQRRRRCHQRDCGNTSVTKSEIRIPGIRMGMFAKRIVATLFWRPRESQLALGWPFSALFKICFIYAADRQMFFAIVTYLEEYDTPDAVNFSVCF